MDIAIESKTIYAVLDLLKAVPDTEEVILTNHKSVDYERQKEYQL